MMDKEKQKEIQKERNYQVVKHNALIQNARHKLSTQEQKILFYLITKIKPEHSDFKEYEFKIKRFCEVCGINDRSGRNYDMLKTTVLDLINKSFWFEVGEDDIDGECISLSWIRKAKVSPKKGIIKLKLDEDMKPYLLDLKKNFTAYDLYYILAMKSKYSIRLYELLKSYEYRGNYTFDLEEFKKLLDAEKYGNYSNFVKFALDIAIREINNLSDICVTYKGIKEGRKYNKVEFTIQLKKDILECAETYKKIEKILNSAQN